MNAHPRTEQFARITVVLEPRADGGLRVYSDDVPGFVLSHPDPSLVILDIEPALDTILSAMTGQNVRTKALIGLKEALDRSLAREDEAPVGRSQRDYVAQIC